MNCPKCQFENPMGAKFCNECGHPLFCAPGTPVQIPSADDKIDKIRRYIPRGLVRKILAQKHKIEGERKQVTVMFCDMEGFVPMVENLGPEKSYSIMDDVYEILIHKVHDFEGTVNEMTGDGVMALFGAPIALEDAPQRALRSSLLIHEEMEFLSRKIKQNIEKVPPLKMRIGIHTGPVVVGTLGNDLRVEFKAVGDTVNLASRMEGMAEPGTTYVTQETFQQTKEIFKFESKGNRIVKGRKGTIPVYKVVSGSTDVYRPRIGTERMIYSEMVGRNKELDRLELQVLKAINGQGSIVNIIGEAGIGKSRLVAELKKRDVMKRVNLLEGRAISIGRNLSFHPIIDLIKQWARINQEDSEAASFFKLESAIKSVCKENMHEVLPFIATVLKMNLYGRYAGRINGIEGEALEKLIIKNVRDLLIKATEQRPLVIVTEDLHWADTSSIELMESLFRESEKKRIIFLNLFRPGFKKTGDRVVETLIHNYPVYYVEIRLEPLDVKMSEKLIKHMLNISDFYHTVISKIVRRASGNPFFIEEVVQSFIDDGAIILKDGTFEVTNKINSISIPYTINDVLMARIDRLEEKTRNLLKVASVIGRNFFYRILFEVAGKVEDIDYELSYLKEIQIIQERKRMGEIEFFFKHALAQEAAYESILPLRRKFLHHKVADSIEKVFSERLNEFYGMLAYHYSKTDSPEKTEEYLIKAGEEAMKSSASSEALHYFQQALALYIEEYDDVADPDKIAMIDKNIAIALYNKGQYEEAIEYFDRALTHCWGELPKTAIGIAFSALAGFLHLIVSLYLPNIKFSKIPSPEDIEAVELFFKKLKAVAVINPKRFFMESFHFYSKATDFDLTRFDLGIGILLGASTTFSFGGISFWLSRKILNFGKDRVSKDDIKPFTIYVFSETLHNYLEGNWKAINIYDDELAKRNLSIGEIYWASQLCYWHGFPNIFQGHFDAAKILVNKLTDLHEVYENDLSLLLKYILNTNLLMARCELHDALIEIEAGIAFVQKAGFFPSLVDMYSKKCRILIMTGDLSEAHISLNQAKSIKSEVRLFPLQLSIFYRSEFEFYLHEFEDSLLSNKISQASIYRKEAFKSGNCLLKVSRKAAQHRTEAYKLMGVYCWLRNKQNKALKWWHKSIKEGKRIGAHLELSRTYFEVGMRLIGSDSRYSSLNGIKAIKYLDNAQVMFEDMNLQWDLSKLQSVVRSTHEK